MVGMLRWPESTKKSGVKAILRRLGSISLGPLRQRVRLCIFTTHFALFFRGFRRYGVLLGRGWGWKVRSILQVRTFQSRFNSEPQNPILRLAPDFLVLSDADRL